MTKEEKIDILRAIINGEIIHPQVRRDVGIWAIKVLEKDIPKTPKKEYGIGYYDWYCPTCNKFLAFECDEERQHIHHCGCGQRLDWAGSEE